MSRSEEFAQALTQHTGIDFKAHGKEGDDYDPALSTENLDRVYGFGANAKLETGHEVHVGPWIDDPANSSRVWVGEGSSEEMQRRKYGRQVYQHAFTGTDPDTVARKTSQTMRSKEFMSAMQQSLKNRRIEDNNEYHKAMDDPVFKTRIDPGVHVYQEPD